MWGLNRVAELNNQHTESASSVTKTLHGVEGMKRAINNNDGSEEDWTTQATINPKITSNAQGSWVLGCSCYVLWNSAWRKQAGQGRLQCRAVCGTFLILHPDLPATFEGQKVHLICLFSKWEGMLTEKIASRGKRLLRDSWRDGV